jgi:hypothetical protein
VLFQLFISGLTPVSLLKSELVFEIVTQLVVIAKLPSIQLLSMVQPPYFFSPYLAGITMLVGTAVQ